MSNDQVSLSPYEILGLKITLDVDEAQLEQAYFQLQNQWHPDRFARKTPTEHITAALKSAEINAAYKRLKDPLESLWVYVESQGFNIQRQDNISDNPKLVEHIFELQDELNDCTTLDAKRKFQHYIVEKITQTRACLSAALAANDNKTIIHNLHYLTYLYKIQKDL